MKILHLSSGNLYGGVETLLATLSRERHLCPEMEPHFALCFPGRLSAELEALGTPATQLGAVQTRFPWTIWRARRALKTLLEKLQPDAVICHMPWTLAIFGAVVREAMRNAEGETRIRGGALRKAECETRNSAPHSAVRTPHSITSRSALDNPHLIPTSPQSAIRNPQFLSTTPHSVLRTPHSIAPQLVFWMHDAAAGKHWIEKWASRCLPDLAISNSRYTAGTLPKLFPRKLPRHAVIYCPVSDPRIILSADERAALRAELNTPADACVIIQVSRMEPYKGAALHLEALGRLADLPGWICWMVGGAQRPHEVKYLAELREQAAQLGIADRVRFLGQRRDVPQLLRAADIFCQPNLRPESFGIVFVEALFAGLPVVSTALGGALEIVDESCGALVPPNDAQALSQSLRCLITHPARRSLLEQNGPARAGVLSEPSSVLDFLHNTLVETASRTEPQFDPAVAGTVGCR